jgi:hypothetical protein
VNSKYATRKATEDLETCLVWGVLTHLCGHKVALNPENLKKFTTNKFKPIDSFFLLCCKE